MRVIVCGGRDFWKTPDDPVRLYAALDAVHAETPITHLWHGNARGADTLAGIWASQRKVKVTAVPAQWSKHGKRAGPIRNQNMLGQGIDMVIAFPGGRGTADMVRRAEKANVLVHKVL